MKKRIVVANWKMNLLPPQVPVFIMKLAPLVNSTEAEVVICAPFTHLPSLLLHTKGTNIKVGAQNMHWEEEGAYTGEVSAPMLASLEVPYIIIGHSERRHHFGETDTTVRLKLKAALDAGLTPVVCVGETLKQRDNSLTQRIITSQINFAFEGLLEYDLEKIVIAYEPIWAIGTGRSATREQANEAICWIRQVIRTKYGAVSHEIPILYGGSVTPENAAELFEMPHIDGGLVGGASLFVSDFAKISNT